MPTAPGSVALRAKFRCLSVTPDNATAPTCVSLVLQAVSADGDDNASWAAATPAGSLSLAITNPGAFDAVVAGQDYYLDLRAMPSDAAEPDDFADHDPATGDAPDYHAGYESRDYPDEIQVGDVIDPVPEAGHDGPQYVTGVTQHPDGTALELRPATPEEIAASAAPETPAPVQPAETKGWQDPVNEAKAAAMRIDSGLSTPAPAPSPEPAPAQAA